MDTTKADGVNSSTPPLRVLILEDNPRDAKLTVSVLEGGGFRVQCEVTDLLEVFRESLEKAEYDVILADFNLRNWTAIDALEILKRSGKDIPLIVVTGTLGDETAVECIKQGAADFVLKDRPARLPMAVRRTLEEKRLREESKRAEEALRESEERFRLIAENVADLIAVLDLEGRRLYNSPSYKELIGEPDAMRGTLSFDEIHPDDREKIKQVFQETVRTGRGQRAEFRFLLPNGSVRFIESQGSTIRDEAGKPIRVLVVSRDVSERKTLEGQLQQAAKMEAIGRLAGGVAHDFNNLLTIINGYAELLLDKFAADKQVGGQLKQIQDAGERAASLTRQLLAFSRRQVLAPQVLDLNAVVSNVEKMLRRLIGEDVKLRTVLDPALGRVKADSGLIEQVIINLAVNARDAMPSGGNLTIETSNVELDESYARNHVTVKPGPYVMLAVGDTGVGMTLETKTHIFEPFFTTKEKGTGLGLATVYGIVKQSGGSIWLYSELGQGTVFKVYLPTVSESPAAKGPAKTETDSASGSETILVVEDEEGVRSLIRLALESAGYKVLETEGTENALATCASYDGPIHLLLTDVVMPKMSGPLVAEKVTSLRPGIKILYMSGYTDDAVVHHGVLSHDMPFIQKPFSPVALRKKIREVLGGK